MPRNPFIGSENIKLGTGIASGAITVGQAIKRTAVAGEFEACNTLGERAHGICWDTAVDGASFSYALLTPGAVFGQALSGGAIGSVGANLTVDAAGKIITTVTPTHHVIGQSQGTTAGADESFPIALEDGLRQL